MTTANLYDILGVPPDASIEAIKAAFRVQAKARHPDSGGDPEKFRDLKVAYDVLSDAEKRRHYDLYTTASEFLLAAVTQAGAPQFDDIVKLMRQMVQQNITATKEQIAAMQQLTDKMAQVAERVHVKEGDNVLRTLIHNRQTELQRKIAASEKTRQIFEDVLEFLNDYNYELYADSVAYTHLKGGGETGS